MTDKPKPLSPGTSPRQPGWYPDPLSPGDALRYHDGTRWWGDTKPNVFGTVTRYNGFFLTLAIISLILTLPGLLTGAVLWLLWGGCWTLFWFGMASGLARPHYQPRPGVGTAQYPDHKGWAQRRYESR